MIQTAGAYDRADRNYYFLAVNDPHYVREVIAREVLPRSTTRMKKTAPVIKTEGGAFNADDKNIYFLATNNSRNQRLATTRHARLLLATNDLMSDKDDDRVLEFLDAGASVFLDSGIFWLTNEHMRAHPGTSMDQALAMKPEDIDGFDDLFNRYVYLAKKFGDRLWGYVELDQGGREQKIKTRAKLEALGLRPIPVYHPMNDGWDYFDYLAERYDRICFGNIVQADQQTRKRLIATAYERKQKYPDLWIHLLGYTPNEWLNAYPIDSADSSTWLAAVRWSGYRETTALRSFSDMPNNYQYPLGGGPMYDKAILMSALGQTFGMMNWRAHLARVEAAGLLR